MKINLHSRLPFRRRRVRIEMLPLIDIVFLLLVFFIYAMLSMAVHHSLPVSLPVSTTAERDTATNLAITVRKGGQFFLDEKELSLEEIQRQLLAQVSQSGSAAEKKILVTIFADRDIPYQDLYRVLDVIRTAGIEDVSLQASSSR